MKNLIDNTRVSASMRELGICEQVKQAMHKKNRVAMILGSLLGSFIPITSYVTARYEVNPALPLWQQFPALLVLGALTYSSISVYQWSRVAFKNSFKAVSFIILMEGTMIEAKAGIFGIPLLALVALFILVGINAIACGTLLALDSKQPRKK